MGSASSRPSSFGVEPGAAAPSGASSALAVQHQQHVSGPAVPPSLAAAASASAAAHMGGHHHAQAQHATSSHGSQGHQHAAGLPPAAPASHQQQHTYEMVGMEGQRITVDIRGADLDEENGWQVWVRRSSSGGLERSPGTGGPHSRSGQLQYNVATAGGVVQGVLGIAISLLTVGKLWEEIRFIKSLRRELGTLAGSLPGLAPGGGGGGGGGAGGPAGGGAPRAAQPPGPSAPGLPPGVVHSSSQARGAGAAAARMPQGGKAPNGGGGGTTKELSLAEELNGAVGGAQGLGVAGGGTGLDGVVRQGFAGISGLDSVKQLLQEVTVLPSLRPDLFTGIRQPPRGVLLFGPPGSGKTMLARAVAHESRASFFAITSSSVLSMWYGQSEANIRALFEKARQQAPSIIFIDEVDSLLGKRGTSPGAPGGGDGSSTTPDRRVTNELLAFLDGIQTEKGDAHVVVMAATNHPWDVDEAALSRFARRIYVPLPDRASRALLLEQQMRGTPCSVTKAQWLQLADKCSKHSGRDLVALSREASMRPLRELWGKRLLSTEAEQEAEREEQLRQQEREAGGQVLPQPQQQGGGAGEAAAPLPAGGKGAPAPGPRERVVGMLARHLRAGRNAKRLRKELAGWRKQQQGAQEALAWCDVDAIMREAAQQAKEAAEEGKKGDAATSASASATQPAAAAAAAPGAGSAEGVAAGSRQEAVGGRAGEEGRAAAEAGAGRAAEGAVASAEGAAEGGERAAPQGEGSGRDAASKAAAAAAEPPEAASAEPPSSATAAAAETTAASDQAQSSGTPPAEPQEAAPKGGGRKRLSSAGGGGKAAAPASGMTLEQLLTLPAEQVRPVDVGDFEAALKLMMPSELELTQQYLEFNDKYGSGADTKRTGAAAHGYLHMYI